MGSFYTIEERIERIEEYVGITDCMVINKNTLMTVKEDIADLGSEIENITKNIEETLQELKEAKVFLRDVKDDLDNTLIEIKKFDKVVELINK